MRLSRCYKLQSHKSHRFKLHQVTPGQFFAEGYSGRDTSVRRYTKLNRTTARLSVMQDWAIDCLFHLVFHIHWCCVSCCCCCCYQKALENDPKYFWWLFISLWHSAEKAFTLTLLVISCKEIVAQLAWLHPPVRGLQQTYILYVLQSCVKPILSSVKTLEDTATCLAINEETVKCPWSFWNPI